jgi:hypothetical protein
MGKFSNILLFIVVVSSILFSSINVQETNEVPPWIIYKIGMILLDGMEVIKNRILPAPVRILEYSNAFWQIQALHIAAELEIADILNEMGPKTCKELAIIAGNKRSLKPLHAENLCRILRALQDIGVFNEEGDLTSSEESGKWFNTPTSHVLRKDHPVSQRSWVINAAITHFPPMGNLLHSVITGESAFESLHNGQPFFDYLAQHPVEGKYFHEGMHNLQALTGQTTITDYPNWSQFKSICDVGGGEGRLITALLKTYPSIQKG